MAAVIPKQPKKEREQITINSIATFCRILNTIAGISSPAAITSSTSALYSSFARVGNLPNGWLAKDSPWEPRSAGRKGN